MIDLQALEMRAEGAPHLCGVLDDEDLIDKASVVFNLARQAQDRIEAGLDFILVHDLNNRLRRNIHSFP